jgi:hypothetical protein
MTRDIVQLPNPDGSLLLRELNHRINNESHLRHMRDFSQSDAVG